MRGHRNKKTLHLPWAFVNDDAAVPNVWGERVATLNVGDTFDLGKATATPTKTTSSLKHQSDRESVDWAQQHLPTGLPFQGWQRGFEFRWDTSRVPSDQDDILKARGRDRPGLWRDSFGTHGVPQSSTSKRSTAASEPSSKRPPYRVMARPRGCDRPIGETSRSCGRPRRELTRRCCRSP